MEELIKWHDHFSVGSSLIDEQHKVLIKNINQLYTAFKKRDMDAIGEILLELKKYTLFHFGTEELLFKEKKLSLYRGTYYRASTFCQANSQFSRRI